MSGVARRGAARRRLGRNAGDAGVLSEVRFSSHDAFVPSLPSSLVQSATLGDKRKGFDAENIGPTEVE